MNKQSNRSIHLAIIAAIGFAYMMGTYHGEGAGRDKAQLECARQQVSTIY